MRRPRPRVTAATLPWILALVPGCYQGATVQIGNGLGAASDGPPSEGDDAPADEEDEAAPDHVLSSATRRLSRREVQQVLWDALALELDAVSTLPEDARTPFDNDYTTQSPSLALVQASYELAMAASEAVVEQPGLVGDAVGCTPAQDATCLPKVARVLGRRLLRRPLSSDEVDDLVALRQEAGDDTAAAGLVVASLVLDPEFLYRIERGQDVDGALALDGPSIASRMSFLLWGSGPDDALLDRGDDLRRADVRREEVQRMLDDDRAVRQLQALHAMWLGYDQTLTSALGESLREETDALIERVLFEERLPWTELLRFDETFVSAELAEHYGLEGSGWVEYADDRRAGLLSHGAYLSTGVNFGITSPTQRGKQVLELLLCMELPAVPEEVMVDEPPGTDDPGACKKDIWSMAALPQCQGCHLLIDSVGFGLEQYGAQGEFRQTEEDRPDCQARREGELAGFGTFSGPGALGRMLADAPEVRECFTQTFLRFALGRADIGDADAIHQALRTSFVDDADLVQMMTALVVDEGFAFRRLDP
ncbi:MAG: DUF1592 domain-containing protein [Myxococcota bacterium]